MKNGRRGQNFEQMIRLESEWLVEGTCLRGHHINSKHLIIQPNTQAKYGFADQKHHNYSKERKKERAR